MAKKQNMVILGVFSMFLATQFSIIINPMLASLAAKYSDIPYSTVLLLSTINGLLSAPASMICGAIAGVKVSVFVLSRPDPDRRYGPLLL